MEVFPALSRYFPCQIAHDKHCDKSGLVVITFRAQLRERDVYLGKDLAIFFKFDYNGIPPDF